MGGSRLTGDGGVALAKGNPLEPLAYPALLSGLVLFGALIAYQGIEAVARALAVAGWGVLWVAGFHVLPMAADALGWRSLLASRHRLPLGALLRLRWIGESINGLLPVMQVGGNVVKARRLRPLGVSGVDAGASVAVDVTLVVFTQMVFTVVGLSAFLLRLGVDQFALEKLTGIVLMAVGVSGFYLVQREGGFLVAARVLQWAAGERNLVSVTGGVAALDAAVTRLYQDRRAIAVGGLWHLASWLIGVGEVWLVLSLLGHPVGLVDALLLESLGQAVRAAGFAIPGALGVQEGGFLALGSVLGLPPETSLALSLSKRARELLLGMPGLVAWQLDASRPSARARMADQFQPPVVFRAVNDGARALLRTARPPVSLDPGVLLDQARRRTGLRDFGDESFIDPFRRVMAAYEEDASLTLIGRMAARNDTLRILAGRLRIEADIARCPAIAEQPVRRPLFITGLPRTGTTILHEILTQDPANRVPLTWETMYPSPPPERARYERDPRIARAALYLQGLDLLAPTFKTIHPLGARLAQECLVITSHAFLSFQFQTTHDVPSYQRWLESQDLRPAYEYHRRFLQQLQWRCPGERWVLKAPAHLFGIEALFAAYPDAGVILTHRDPLEVAASVASLTATLRGAFSDRIDPVAIGREMTERWADGLTRALRTRDAHPEWRDQFLDVHYRDLVHDPIGTVRGIYRHFGLELGDEAEARMRAFLARNPKDKHGRHRYTLEQFGLDATEERRRYAAYRERFGL